MTPRFRHRFPEVGRSCEILGPLRVLGIEDHDNLTLVIGRAEDTWIAKARCLLH